MGNINMIMATMTPGDIVLGQKETGTNNSVTDIKDIKEIKEIITNLVDQLADPKKAVEYSRDDIQNLKKALLDKPEKAELFKRLDAKFEKYSKEIYKYNISRSGVNSVLSDLRNYNNFRTTFDEYYNPVEKDNQFNLAAGRRHGTSSSKSFYMSASDFLFSETFNMDINEETKPLIQPIILNEFQPDQIQYLSKFAMNIAESIAKTVLRKKRIKHN